MKGFYMPGELNVNISCIKFDLLMVHACMHNVRLK